MERSAKKTCPHKQTFNTTNDKGERRTVYVLIFTLITMVVEIIAGSVYGSMALLADGWHMSTHAAAFIITLFTYRYARKHADSQKFSFGTGKVGALGGFSSAVALTLVALVMLVESMQRLWSPETIHFNEAIFVAVLGLLVNLVSAYLLKDDHTHHHGYDHAHGDKHAHQHEQHAKDQHQDHNLKAAYMHVLADALTSVLAIVALIAAKYWGWNWLDAMMGVVGAVIITRWSIGLIKQTSPVLLDASIDEKYMQDMIFAIENEGINTEVMDFHVWKVSSDHYAGMVTISSSESLTSAHFKKVLSPFDKISHLTIEVTTSIND